MFPYLSRIILRTRIKRNQASRQKRFLPWEKIESIALILNQNDSINKSAIDKFVSETKKYIEVFYIEIKSKEPSYGDWICICKKDRSVLNLPNKKTEIVLKNKKFDLVINACADEDLFSAAIFSSLSAPYKCAGSSVFIDADLVITPAKPRNVINYLNDAVHYLKMIRQE